MTKANSETSIIAQFIITQGYPHLPTHKSPSPLSKSFHPSLTCTTLGNVQHSPETALIHQLVPQAEHKASRRAPMSVHNTSDGFPYQTTSFHPLFHCPLPPCIVRSLPSAEAAVQWRQSPRAACLRTLDMPQPSPSWPLELCQQGC